MIFFFFNDTATTEIYTLSLHDALPILTKTIGTTVAGSQMNGKYRTPRFGCSKASFWKGVSSDKIACVTIFISKIGEHTSELQSRQYLVCRLLLEKKKKILLIIHTLHLI